MIPKAIGSLVWNSDATAHLRTQAEQVVDRSTSSRSPLTDGCASIPEGESVTVLIDVGDCGGAGENHAAGIVNDIAQKWNAVLRDMGIGLQYQVKNTNEDPPPNSFTVSNPTCILIPDGREEHRVLDGLVQQMRLACPSLEGIDPTLVRALSTQQGSFTGFSSFPYGESRPAACGAPFTLAPTDAAAMAQMCRGDGKVYAGKMTDHLVQGLTLKYGNNIVGHFLGAIVGDFARRAVEVAMIRCGDFKDSQWKIKLLGEVVALTAQVSVMAYFGGYTVVGGVIAGLIGYAAGLLAEFVLPECLRAVTMWLNPTNLSFAFIDQGGGTGGFVGDGVASATAHWVAQAALRAIEGALEKFCPELNQTKREMLAQGGFSLWDSLELTRCREPMAPWNLGRHMPQFVMDLRYYNQLMGRFIQRYLNAMVFRERLYKTDLALDEQYVIEQFKKVHDLAMVMERVDMERPATDITVEQLLEEASCEQEDGLLAPHGAEELPHDLSFRYQVADARGGLWTAFCETLNARGEKIRTLDMRGLRFADGSGTLETPYEHEEEGLTKLRLPSLTKLEVLALDARPDMFDSIFWLVPFRNYVPNLRSLRLTAPSDASTDTPVGVPPTALIDKIVNKKSLIHLTADVCTDPAYTHMPSRRTVHKEVRDLYEAIATSGLHRVNLRLMQPVEFAREWMQHLAEKLDRNYLLCEFLPLQAESARVHDVMERNRELQHRLLDAVDNEDAFQQILTEVPEKARPSLESFVRYLAAAVAANAESQKNPDAIGQEAVYETDAYETYELTSVSVEGEEQNENPDVVFSMEKAMV